MKVSTLILIAVSFVVLQPVLLFSQQCPVVDLMPQFWQIVDGSSKVSAQMQIEEFRKDLIQDHGDLYSATGVGFDSDQKLDAAILRELAAVRAHPESTRKMSALLEHDLPLYIRHFQRHFPDFRCNFPIYLLPSLGQLDGAGRVVNGQPSLLIGVDNAATEYTQKTLRIFVDHELFHRYHFQVAGFSDDKGDHDILWRTLWAEGLATYASEMLNPGATLQDALILPKDLVTKAQPQLTSLIAQIMPDLDRSDPKMFAAFFEYHAADTVIPSRAGYYLGARVAEQLALKGSLFTLAHLQADAAKDDIVKALSDLGRGDSVAVSAVRIVCDRTGSP